MKTKELTREDFSSAIENGIYEITKILGIDKYEVTFYKLCLRTESLIINII
jgi:hypothetical protein